MRVQATLGMGPTSFLLGLPVKIARTAIPCRHLPVTTPEQRSGSLEVGRKVTNKMQGMVVAYVCYRGSSKCLRAYLVHASA